MAKSHDTLLESGHYGKVIMTRKFLGLLGGLLVSLLIGCSNEAVLPTASSQPDITAPTLNATLWMQKSAEYRALSLQNYLMATRQLDAALGDLSWHAALEQVGDAAQRPPAIILDVDETFLDNSHYEAELIQRHAHWDSDSWNDWLARAEAEALPGALAFIRQAQAKGVSVFLITNRACVASADGQQLCPQKQQLLDNLRKLGLDSIESSQVLLKNERAEWTSEKQSRRASIASQYRVLMLFGDDLGDFIPGARRASLAQRQQWIAEYANYWGNRWFLFPNPIYGSWYDLLPDPKANSLDGYRQ